MIHTALRIPVLIPNSIRILPADRCCSGRKIQPSLQRRGRRAGYISEQRLAIAREIGDRRAEGNALGNLGMAYHSLGEYGRALEFYEEDLAIARETRDRHREGTTLWNLSLALERIGNRAQAIQRAEDSLKIKQETEHPGTAPDQGATGPVDRLARVVGSA